MVPMDETMDKKRPLSDLMRSTMDKIREMADTNTIVGQPIVTGEVTIIPISRLSVGVGSGGTEFGSKHKKPEDNSCFGGGAGAGINLIPVGFLVVKDGVVRMLNIQPPAMTTLDRVIDLVPQLLDRAEAFIDKKNAPAPTETVAE